LRKPCSPHGTSLPAAKHEEGSLQFGRVTHEFAKWRAVPEAQRSPTPAWLWQPAFEVCEQQEAMSPIWCRHLELPIGRPTRPVSRSFRMAVLADQTALPWTDELLRKIERAHKIGTMTVVPTVRGMFRTPKSSEVSLTA
jgi:hypothetical protein